MDGVRRPAAAIVLMALPHGVGDGASADYAREQLDLGGLDSLGALAIEQSTSEWQALTRGGAAAPGKTGPEISLPSGAAILGTKIQGSGQRWSCPRNYHSRKDSFHGLSNSTPPATKANVPDVAEVTSCKS